MNTVESLLPSIALQAPGIPEPILEQALLLTMQEFFKESEAWTPRLDRFLTIGIVNEFDIPLPTGTRFTRIHWVRVERTTELDPITYEDIAEDRRHGYFVTNEDSTILLTTPTPRGWTEVHGAIYPATLDVTLPKHLFEDFRQLLVNLTLARLYGMVGTAWEDLTKASLLASLSEGPMLQAKRLANNRRSGGRKTVRYGGIR